MTRRVYTVTPSWSLLSAARLLRNHHISGVPVVAATEEVVGVLSEADIVEELRTAVGLGTARGTLDLLLTAGGFRSRTLLTEAIRHLRRTPVAEAMTTPAAVLELSATVGDATRLLADRGINRAPVVEERRLVGLVSRQDLVDLLRPADTGRRRGPRRRFSRGPS